MQKSTRNASHVAEEVVRVVALQRGTGFIRLMFLNGQQGCLGNVARKWTLRDNKYHKIHNLAAQISCDCHATLARHSHDMYVTPGPNFPRSSSQNCHKWLVSVIPSGKLADIVAVLCLQLVAKQSQPRDRYWLLLGPKRSQASNTSS